MLNVVAPPAPLACNALDLIIWKSGKVTVVIWLPVFVLEKSHNAPGHATSKGPRPNTSPVCFLACERSVLTVALLGKSPTFEALKVVDEVLVRCNKLGGLLHRLPLGVPLTKLTLIKCGGTHARILEYLWPRMDLVQVASCRLLVDEIEVVSELFEGNLSSKFC